MIDIYYVEDDENIARIVEEYLEQRSCRVSVFHTIAAAQKAFEGHVPAAALVSSLLGGEGVRAGLGNLDGQ